MRRKISKNNSVNPVDAGFHHYGSQYSLRASNQSAETGYKPNEVAKESVHKVYARPVCKTRIEETDEEEEKWKEAILSRIIELESRFGGCPPGLIDLYCAGFEPAEIHAVWDDLVWLYGSDWDTKGPVDIQVLEQANEELLKKQARVVAGA